MLYSRVNKRKLSVTMYDVNKMAHCCVKCCRNFNSRQALYKHTRCIHKMDNLGKLVETFPQYYTQKGGKYYCNDYEIVDFDSRFKHPTTIMVTAPTKAGKTTLIRKIIQNINHLFNPVPEKVLWYYNEHQPSYNLENVTYLQSDPDIEQLKSTTHVPKLLILDDMMLNTSTSLKQLFTRGCHHWNCSIIHIVQDIFFDRKRTNRINTQYIFLLKSPGDKLTALNLARQMFPRNIKYFMTAYEQATEKPHGYLLVDLDQNTPERLRLRTGILPGETMFGWINQ